MLMPKKVKYRKQQRGRMRGLAWRGSTVSFGDFGLMSLEPCWLTDRQIEAARVALTRASSAAARSGFACFPDKPITKKPQETRMGKGKGAPEALGGGRSSRAASSSRWKACRRPRRVRRCGSRRRSCR